MHLDTAIKWTQKCTWNRWLHRLGYTRAGDNWTRSKEYLEGVELVAINLKAVNLGVLNMEAVNLEAVNMEMEDREACAIEGKTLVIDWLVIVGM